MSSVKLAIFGVVAALWAALAIAVPAQSNAQTAADEPHYLLTAISLGEDASLDVTDELNAQRYRAFHKADLPRQAEAAADGSRVVPHDPALPALLALPMRAGGWVAAKLTLAALFGVLAVAMAWTAIRRFAVPPRVALLVVATFAAAAPLVVYGTQVYPELLAALAVTVAIAALTAALDKRALAVFTAAVVSLPWLSVKYSPTAAVLVAIALWQLVREGRGGTAIALVGALTGAAAVFAVAHFVWYGGLTPYASGYYFRTGELGVMGTHPNYIGRSIRLVGLLFDRNFGLVVWQPAVLLAVVALTALLRRRPRHWEVLVLPLAAGWLTATFVALTMNGWWFPGRQVVHVLPCAVLSVAWLAHRDARIRPWLWVALVYGASVYLWLVVEGLVGDVTMVVDFARLSQPAWLALHQVLPDYRNLGAAGFMLHLSCIAVVALLVRTGWRWAADHAPAQRREPALTKSAYLEEVPA